MSSKFPMRPHIKIKNTEPFAPIYRMKNSEHNIMNESTARGLFDLGYVHLEILTDDGWVDYRFENKKPGSSPG